MTSQKEKPNRFSTHFFLIKKIQKASNKNQYTVFSKTDHIQNRRYIMNAYFENTSYGRNITRERQIPARKYGDGFISFICAIIGIFTCPAAVKLEKTALSLVLFIAFFSVVGGIESGALTMLAGILICAVISLFEYATLKSLFKRVK